MLARRMLKTLVALFGALSLACVGEPRVHQPRPPSFTLQHARPFYEQHNLVSDGAVSAGLVDAALVNAWGLVASATSPFWVADNGTGLSTLYNGNTGGKISLTVTVPGAPTGVVFNSGADFVVTSGTRSGPARFIFASEDGTISGWNPAVAATQAVVGVDNSAGGAVYKGLAIASTAAGVRLYATNFHAGTVDVFDAGFHPVSGGVTDAHLPRGYGPFGIQQLEGSIYVTYALQNAEKHDDVAGEGHGVVNAFDTRGHLLRRVASRGRLDSPWGLALAPADFGEFSGDLLVGNFGDGHINAFDVHRRHDKVKRRGQPPAPPPPPAPLARPSGLP